MKDRGMLIGSAMNWRKSIKILLISLEFFGFITLKWLTNMIGEIGIRKKEFLY